MASAVDYFPVPGSGGRPVKGTPEEVDVCMWLLAIEGGSATRAWVRLQDQFGWEHISRKNISDWARGRFSELYMELRTRRARDLEELAASNAMDVVALIDTQEREAVKRIAAGLGSTNAVEASLILRNLTQAKGANLERAGQIRGREGFAGPGLGLLALAQQLAASGAARIVEPERIVEATAIEEIEAA